MKRWRIVLVGPDSAVPQLSFVCDALTAAAALGEFERLVMPTGHLEQIAGPWAIIVKLGFRTEPLGVQPGMRPKRGQG